MLNVVVPQDTEKRQKQIAALEWQIQRDPSEKDRQVHQEALKKLKEG